nr:PREDICTED: protein FAM217B [Lepisosteus oculatus]XP_015220395.1 PREDICTED: protein FAM217B [Lepisosteus oculatus]XP_015220396.1 PREDICTED: protein FAM217B [Lepisosteus oculatus]XP_015220397.1 PREDICTED: protein FAM217B [Lepisosteus oculatus]XP_015220398.1 PREDICTED: protein FAM217B [Lepisosteus oculatus]XP_015220399.1 PREDICTED: protein FAM217B [Lepisosteus oculatus]
MSPVLQERPGTTALKKGSSKDRIRTKASGNIGQVTSSKKGKAILSLRAQKKSGAQPKHGSPRQGKELPQAAERGSQRKGCRTKSGSLSVTESTTLSPSPDTARISGKEDGKPLLSPLAEGSWREKVLPGSCSGSETDVGSLGSGKSRPLLSLPLVPPQEKRCPELGTGQPPSLETLKLYAGEEDDGDNASDLSDSERLPVLPSPCTPPQLHLRAEVVDPSDLHPYFPGARGGGSPGYSYPDFLPPPFSSWSLRQLALFLNTEGKGAPRPKPVGQLERYLERLLQLEWLQIQTVQAEGSKSPSLVSAARPRPHTAPPAHLSSPKSLRQCQRAFPLAFLSCLGNPSAPQLSRPACPHCRVHYPFCNGACRAYAYQRHSRLSPLLERRAGACGPQRRSSSESRVASSDPRPGVQGQKPESPSPGAGHLKRMQAAGNIRNPLPVPASGIKPPAAPRGGCAPSAARSSSQKSPVGGKSLLAERGASSRSLREVSPLRRGGNERQRALTGVLSQETKQDSVLTEKDPSPVSKGPSAARSNGRVKHVQFMTK